MRIIAKEFTKILQCMCNTNIYTKKGYATMSNISWSVWNVILINGLAIPHLNFRAQSFIFALGCIHGH